MKYKLLARGMSIKRQRHCQGSKNHPIPLCSPYAVGRHGVSALSAPGSGDTGALMVWLAIREGLAASGNRQLCWRLLATQNFAVVVRGGQADGVVARGGQADGVAGRNP